jgi:serine palmitoyltransferase
MGFHECQASWFTTVTTYFGYLVLWLFGRLRDFFSVTFATPESLRKGYAPLTRDFEDFFTRRMYRRIRDCWNRPVCGVPGAYIDVIPRESKDYNKTFILHRDREPMHCLNLGSYNYLGFGQKSGPCTETSIAVLRSSGQSMCSARRELGTHPAQLELERTIAQFVGKPDAVIFGMGYATNSCSIPLLLATKEDLVISDAQNHASLITGVRSSQAHVRVFRHNDPANLETVLRQCICEGQPRTGRPWRKILIVAEGIDSMGGDVCRLAEIVAIKKKYKAYLYLDEAHSIGAMGPSGRGICEHAGVDPKDVDILMGTFTKSFGSVGGYIAGAPDLIAYLKRCSWGQTYATAMSPACAQQALSALWTIMGCAPIAIRTGRENVAAELKMITPGTQMGDGLAEDGPGRIARLHKNSNYFRRRLQELGFEVLGDRDSPVVPVITYQPSKMPSMSRYCLRKGLAIVVVGYPATPMIESRIRFCISAAHTISDLDKAIEVISRAGDIFMCKYFKNKPRVAKELL